MTFLHVRFDPQDDAGYVRIAEGRIDGSSEEAPGLIVDGSVDDEPLGIEVLYVRRRLSGGDPESHLRGLAEGWLAARTPMSEAAE